MSDNQVLFTFTADTTKLLSSIKDSMLAIDNLKKSVVAYSQPIETLKNQTIEVNKNFNATNETLKKSSIEITNNISQLKKQNIAYSENIIKLKDNIKAYQDDIDIQVKHNIEIKNKIKNLNEESRLLGKITQDNVQEKAAIADKIKTLKDEQETVNKNISTLKETQKITKDNLFLVNQSQSAISNNIKYLQLQDQEVKKVTQSTKEQTKALQENNTLNEKDSLKEKQKSIAQLILLTNELGKAEIKRINEQKTFTKDLSKQSALDLELQTNKLLDNQNKAKQQSTAQLVLITNSLIQAEKTRLEQQKQADSQQKLLTKATVSQATSELIAEETRLINNQNKAKQDAIRIEQEKIKAEKEKVNAITNTINVLKLEQKEISVQIGLYLQQIQGVKAVNQANIDHINNVKASIAPLQMRKNHIDMELTSLERQKLALSNTNVGLQGNNSALQTNIAALAQHKETLNNNSNHVENFRNTIWELVYALRGMEQGLNLIIATPFTSFSREFDKNMYNMNSIALESVQNFAMLREQLIQISKDNNYSGLNQLSESLYQAYSAGFKLQGALELVREADKGALAGLARTEDVLKALVTVLHAYNMTADQASRINNIFLKTVQEGVITMPELTRTIGQAVTIAPELGIAFEDIAGAFVATTRQGINAHETVTAINAVLKTFLDPSKEASSYAKELGINLSASAFEGKSFGNVIKEISQKADIDIVGKIFGNTRALKGFFKLAKDDGEKFIQFENDMKDNTDAVAKAMEEQRKSYDQTLTQLKNTFEISMNDIGMLAQQIFTPVLKFFTELLRLFNEIPTPIKGLIGGLTILGTTLTGVTIGLAGAISGLKALGFEITAETTGISLMSGAMKGLIANIGLLGTTLTGVEAGMGAFAIGAGAIGAIGAGVGAVGYTAYQGYKAYDDNKEFEKKVEEISKSEKKAQEIADKYKSQDSPLTYLEKMEYARALIQADATSKANKELALRLMASAKAEIDNEKHIQEQKQKLNLETAEKNKKTREGYEAKQKEISDLVDQATMSDTQLKIKRVARDYDEKIKLASDYANLQQIFHQKKKRGL